MSTFFRQTLLIRSVRKAVGLLRYFYFVRIWRNVRTLESGDAIDRTVSHNLKALRQFGGTRMNLLIRPVSVLENISDDARILVIGPRNEDDLLSLIGHGFNSANITGLDLITYSPLIEVGDMHKMRFSD